MTNPKFAPRLALAALSDPTRNAIFERLAEGPLSVGEIAATLPVTRPAVSQHLKVLKDAELVSDEAQGTRRVYRIDPAGLGQLRRCSTSNGAGRSRISRTRWKVTHDRNADDQARPDREGTARPRQRERAFAVFAKMGGWWLEGHSVLKQLHGTEQADLVIEPRTGGRWYELGENGKEYDWGRVLAWEPPARLLLCWQLNGEFTYDPALETTIEVTFTEDGDHTLVRFEHRDLERFARRPRRCATGWIQVGAGCLKLTRFRSARASKPAPA